MKKNKGFTLIELLAVIVILAVIALIATPIIMNVINDSKKGAAKDSTYGYISAATYDLFHEKDGELSYGDYTVNANGNLVKDGKEITVNLKGNKPTGGAITLNSDGRVGAALKFGTDCVVKYLTTDEAYIMKDSAKCDASISSNLIKNGYGELENNTNFRNFTYNATGEYSASGLFQVFTSDDLIPVDTTKTYFQTVDLKTSNTKAIYYVGMKEYDVDRLEIVAHQVVDVPNTTTTLTKDLKDGDTVVYLSNVTNFRNASTTPSDQLGFIFWNYKDSTGYQYPTETYSRNVWLDLYLYTGINKSNNTITLKAPWNHGTIKAGTQLSQSRGGGYNYGLLSGSSLTTDWKTYTSTISGVSGEGIAPNNKFRYSTKYVKFLMLHNYNSTADTTTYYRNITLKEQ